MSDRNYMIPPVDIFETLDKYILVMDMPGADKDAIEIDSNADTLSVSGKILEADKDWKPVVTEFSLADYKREFTIGSKVNRDKIIAKYENGILSIEMEKSEMAKPKKIEVKAG